MKKKLQKSVGILVMITLLTAQIPPTVHAVEQNSLPLKITEIYSNADTGESEWIELHSLSTEPQNLAGLTIWDDVGKIYTIPEGFVLAPKAYLVISGWTNKLNNTGDSVIIKSIDGEIVTSVIDFPAVTKGMSWYPQSEVSDVPTPGIAHPDYDTPGETPAPSPGDETGEPDPSEEVDETDDDEISGDPEMPDPEEEEAVPSPTPSDGEGDDGDPEETLDEGDEQGAQPSPPATIFVSEIVSNPIDGEGEWVEIFSEENESFDLAGFVLADEIGDFFVFPTGSVVEPNGYLVVTGWGNKLNNTGDSLFLKRPDGSIFESAVAFPVLEKGESWLPREQKKGIPTRGAANQLLEPEPSPETPAPNPTPDPVPTASPTPSVEPTSSPEPSPTTSASPIPLPAIPFPEYGDIEISEIMSNPLENESEWVELVSSVDSRLDLSGCTLSDAIGVIYTFPKGAVLEPDTYLVIDGWSNKLNNTGDSLFLRWSDGSELASVIDFPVLEKGVTWLPNEALEGIPTPGESNEPREAEVLAPEEDEEQEISLPEEEILIEVGEVVVNEVMSNPTEGEEWIELLSHSDRVLSLTGLVIYDALGAILVLDETHIIAPDEYLVVSGWSNKLNNTGDTVTLQTASGKVINGPHQIPAITQGSSFSIDFAEATMPTPGEANLLPIREEEPPAEEDESEPSPEPTEEISEETDEWTDLGIIINEVFPSPTNGAEEWVELMSHMEIAVDLSDFTLYDAQGMIATFAPGSRIEPNGYAVITGWSGKLNNGGDTVTLRTASGSIVSEISYPSISAEKSWGFDGSSYRRTDRPTPASANIFPASTSGGGGSSGDVSEKKKIPVLLKKAAGFRSAKRDMFELEINEVLFSGTSDFVELYCRACDLDLAGVRVADDNAFFEFPEKSEVATGEYIVIHFAQESEDMRHENGVWHFWGQKSGLTASDETIFVIDSWGQVEDALCIANQNGKFSPGEEEDVVLLIKQGILRAERPLTEQYCFDSAKVQKGKVLLRNPERSGYANLDYFAGDTPSPGKANPSPPRNAQDVDLRIEKSISITTTQSIVGITNVGGSAVILDSFYLQIADEEPIPLPGVRLYHQQTHFISIPSLADGTRLELRDYWGNIEAELGKSSTELTEANTGLMITEVLANPDGIDTGNEFVELSCMQEKCAQGTFVLKIGEKTQMVPRSDMRQNEIETYTEFALRNSDLQLALIDPQHASQQVIDIPKARSGASFARWENEFVWSMLPTPGEANIIADENSMNDTDRDGIPDLIERELELDPHTSDRNNPTVMRLYHAHLRDLSQIQVTESEQGLTIHGKTLPFTKGKLVLHSQQHVFEVVADAEGNFALEVTPDIEPGTHSLDLLIEQADKRFVALADLETIEVVRNPQGDWLKQVAIYRVLPNPDGADGKREYVILENPTETAGWLKKAVLSNGKKQVTLPDTFFAAGEKKVFFAKQIPTLTNKNGMVKLLDGNGKVLDTLAWKSAKSGQLYWQDMPPVVTRAKKGKTTRAKSGRSRYPVQYGPEYFEQKQQVSNLRYLGISENILLAETAEGIVVTYPLDKDLSAEFLQKSLSVGDAISLGTIGGVVVTVHKHPPTQIGEGISVHRYRHYFLLFLMMSLLISFGITVTLTRLQRKHLIHKA